MENINSQEFSRLLNSGGEIKEKNFIEATFISSRELLKGITFVDCVFEKPIRFTSAKIKGGLSFFDCLFKEHVYFIDTTFNRTPEIKDCKFQDEVIFNSCILPGLNISGGKISKLTFSNSLKNIGVHFGDIKFLGNVQIEKLELKKLITDKSIKLIETNVEILTIRNSILEESLSFGSIDEKKSYIGKEVFITSSKVFGRVDFHNGEIEKSIYIQKVDFNEQFVFRSNFQAKEISMDQVRSGYTVSVDYEDNLETMNLSNLVFDLGISVFQGSILPSNDQKTINPERGLDINFSGLFYGNFFSDNIRVSTIHLHGSNFGNIVFNNISTHWIWVTDYINNGKVHFKGLKLNESFNVLVIHDASMGNVEFENINFMKIDELVVSKSEVSSFSLTNCVPPRRIQIRTKNPKIGVGPKICLDTKISDDVYFRDSYRQLKQSMEKAGNRDFSLHYKSLEMHYQWKELRIGWDKILLTFNLLTNNHGVSWVRGISFTLICAFVSFSLLVSQLDDPYFMWNYSASWNEIQKGFVAGLPRFLNYLSTFPTLTIPGLNENNYIVGIVILMSRIFVSIGIFQTISAFRKYGGKS